MKRGPELERPRRESRIELLPIESSIPGASSVVDFTKHGERLPAKCHTVVNSVYFICLIS